MPWVAPQAEVEAALRDHPQVVAGCEEVAQSLRATAMGLARVRAYESGEYASSIVVVAVGDGTFMVVATSGHAWFVEVGTGIFGPRGAVIFAAAVTASGMFKFQVRDRGADRTVITDRQKGRPARHVMGDAAAQTAGLPGVSWQPNPI